jgi:hypothetical protein
LQAVLQSAFVSSNSRFCRSQRSRLRLTRTVELTCARRTTDLGDGPSARKGCSVEQPGRGCQAALPDRLLSGQSSRQKPQEVHHLPREISQDSGKLIVILPPDDCPRSRGQGVAAIPTHRCIDMSQGRCRLNRPAGNSLQLASKCNT